MIHKIRNPIAVILYISIHGMSLDQSKCFDGTKCSIIKDMKFDTEICTAKLSEA